MTTATTMHPLLSATRALAEEDRAGAAYGYLNGATRNGSTGLRLWFRSLSGLLALPEPAMLDGLLEVTAGLPAKELAALTVGFITREPEATPGLAGWVKALIDTLATEYETRRQPLDA